MAFPKKLKIPIQENPIRLDKFLVQQFPHTSRNFWKDKFQFLKLSQHRCKKNDRVYGGENLEFDLEYLLFKQSTIANPKLKIKIVFEDKDFLVVEKPAGIPTHPLSSNEENTLIQGVLTEYPEIASVGKSKLEAGLVHRLDNETSGLVLIARNQKSYLFLREEFQKRRVEKEYFALVEGKLDQKDWKEIDLAIAHHPKNKKKMIVKEEKHISLKARTAITFYKTEHVFTRHTLLKVKIITGVRHQIRVHLAFLGHPVAGDLLYSKGENEETSYSRMFLHASNLCFRHPQTKKKLEFESTLPKEFTP